MLYVSDSSDDESQKISKKQPITSVTYKEPEQVSTSDNETAMEYKDVSKWSRIFSVISDICKHNTYYPGTYLVIY